MKRDDSSNKSSDESLEQALSLPPRHPHRRELAEPRDEFASVPLWLVFGIMALAMWGGWYLSEHAGDFQGSVLEGDAARSLTPDAETSEPVAVDPMLLGRRIYNNCLACHQSDGQGLPGQFPPLAGAEWVLGDHRVLVRIVLQGLSGPIHVLGSPYDGQMPGWEHLSDRDIAAVSTFVRNSWGNKANAVTEDQVAAERQATAGRRMPWSAGELTQLPAAEPAESEAAGEASESEESGQLKDPTEEENSGTVGADVVKRPQQAENAHPGRPAEFLSFAKLPAPARSLAGGGAPRQEQVRKRSPRTFQQERRFSS